MLPGPAGAGTLEPTALEIKDRTAKVWGASPAGAIHAPAAEPGTREFFEAARRRRNGYEIPWLADLVPFAAMAGRSVLEVGCGAGFDAYDFCRSGARYTGMDITPENPRRTRAHLALYGLTPALIRADAEDLPFRSGTFDVVFSNGVLHHTPDIGRSLREARRVLRTGGDLWVVLYHRNSFYYGITLFLFDHILYRGFRRRTLRERLSMIEYTTSGERPLVNVYSRREVRSMLAEAGLEIESLWVRKLVAEDLPDVPLFRRLWKFIPRRWLDGAGRIFGWYVIARARKP